MPRGVEFKIPMQAALDAHREHMAGWSLRALARMRWEEWGYASPESALEGLHGVFRALDLPIRSRRDAILAFNTVHGNSTRAARDPGHPDHERFLEHRRRRRANARHRQLAAEGGET